MKADFHTHTDFSSDGEYSPEEIIEAAIEKGLKTICITDHHDIDFPKYISATGFQLDFDAYFEKLKKLQEFYKEKIDIRIGVELGLQPHLSEECKAVVEKYPFDFVIGSIHIIDGKDPYYKEFFENITDEEGYRRTFEVTLETIQNVSSYDVLGHLDYVVRYGIHKDRDYSYAKYADLIDEILRLLIANGKGLEVNTGGWKNGLAFPNPHSDVVKRYKELGGEIITVGSDGHRPIHIGYDFHRIGAYLRECGFKFYTEFRKRQPVFMELP